jgi:hypothetical protein
MVRPAFGDTPQRDSRIVPTAALQRGPELATTWKVIIRNQFEAAIDMLENAIRAGPNQLRSELSRRPEGFLFC